MPEAKTTSQSKGSGAFSSSALSSRLLPSKLRTFSHRYVHLAVASSQLHSSQLLGPVLRLGYFYIGFKVALATGFALQALRL